MLLECYEPKEENARNSREISLRFGIGSCRVHRLICRKRLCGDAGRENMSTKEKISVEQYLEKVAQFSENEYGTRFRRRFRDARGTSELAMLACPTAPELDELRRAVAIMTPAERQEADRLSDEQVARIAADARIDPGNLAIFFNGYALTCKRVS